MAVTLSYWNDNVYCVPTSVTTEEFNSLAEAAKYCLLLGGIIDNSYIMPIVYDKDSHKCYDVTSEFIREYCDW